MTFLSLLPQLSTRNFVTYANFACDPSQNGGFAVCLHMHQATFFFSAISTFTGVKPFPLCDPSQNGWVEEYPQEHHQ